MGAGGPPHRYLGAVRGHYPVSLHGVGLSIGADRPLDRNHLRRLQALIERYSPVLFSEHLAWSSHDVGFLNDLLPIPYTAQTLARVTQHVDEVQETLGRQMLLENPSTYLAFAKAAIRRSTSSPKWRGERDAASFWTSTMSMLRRPTTNGIPSLISMRFRSPRCGRFIWPVMRGRLIKGPHTAHRYARPAGRFHGLGLVPACRRPHRPGADADRMGCGCARLDDSAGGSGPG